MTVLAVTGTAEVGGQVVTGTATAEVSDDVPRRGITEVIEVTVDARRLLVFAELVEGHAAAIRRDLERFMAGEEPRGGFEWFGREDRSSGRGE